MKHTIAFFSLSLFALGSLVGSTTEPTVLTVPTPVHPTQAVSILDSAAQTGTEELLDLDDGRIPQSWNLDVIRRGPGLVNDRLEGRATDSGAELWKEITLAPGSEMLELSHDGNLEDSYWGHITQAFFILRSGERISLTNMRATANWGDANVIAMLWGKKKREETQYSRMSGTFSFEWRITQDEIIGSVKDYYSGQVLQSAQYRTPGRLSAVRHRQSRFSCIPNHGAVSSLGRQPFCKRFRTAPVTHGEYGGISRAQ